MFNVSLGAIVEVMSIVVSLIILELTDSLPKQIALVLKLMSWVVFLS